MANRSLHPLLHYLRRLKSGKAGDSALDDMHLLHRFLTQRDESAFTTLVQRYGAMVWGLCARRLGETPEAEDAFQATFLVLVRKAASLRGPQQLGPWLYGVAYRTALKLQGQRARRAARETPLPEQIAEKRAESIESDLGPVLDEEINRLPTKYRLPVLLCYLQGLSSEEAAQRLGCAKGTVFSRLSRARDLLRRRLVRRGVDVSAGVLAAVLADNAVLRAAPPAALVEGVVRSMFLSKVKFIAIVVLTVVIAGAGTGFLGYRSDAQTPSSKSSSPVNQHQSRAEAPAPAIAKAEAPVQPNPNVPAQNHVVSRLREQLSQEIDYQGIDDARATLSDALDQISKRYGITFDINEEAFEMSPLYGGEPVGLAKITDPTPIPPMRTTLSTVRRRILRRVHRGATRADALKSSPFYPLS